MNNQNDSIIITTLQDEASYKAEYNKTVFGSILIIAFGVFLKTFIPDLHGLIAGFGLIFLGMYVWISRRNASKSRSYCSVYSTHVSGVTTVKTSSQSFSLPYSEIKNITCSQDIICIYTAYTTYEIHAELYCNEVVREIQKRINLV